MKFSQNHEWVLLQDHNIASVGISKSAINELENISHIDLPKKGKKFKAYETAAVIESSKAAIDVYTPVSGKIVEINPIIKNNPNILIKENFDPKNHWLFKIQLELVDEYEQLMNEQAYEAWKKQITK
jgi:glycine cleavage system H protein